MKGDEDEEIPTDVSKWTDGVGHPSVCLTLTMGYCTPAAGAWPMNTPPLSSGTSQSAGDTAVPVVMTVPGFALHY